MEGLAGADEATSVILLLLFLWYFLNFSLLVLGNAVASDWPRFGRVLGWAAILSGAGEFLVTSVPWIVPRPPSVEDLVGLSCFYLILILPIVGGRKVLARSSIPLQKRRHPGKASASRVPKIENRNLGPGN